MNLERTKIKLDYRLRRFGIFVEEYFSSAMDTLDASPRTITENKDYFQRRVGRIQKARKSGLEKRNYRLHRRIASELII